MEFEETYPCSLNLYDDPNIHGSSVDDCISPKIISNYDLIFTPIYPSKRAKGQLRVVDGASTQFIYEYENPTFKRAILKAIRSGGAYKIYTEFGSEKIQVGTLKRSLFGHSYSLYEGETRICTIEYERQCLAKKGPRMFKVCVFENRCNYKINKMKYNMISTPIFCNKRPVYNLNTGAYMLNFNGRVSLPSARNFQLIHSIEPNYITITFGKLENNVYALDHTFPWNGLQAFGIGLTSML